MRAEETISICKLLESTEEKYRGSCDVVGHRADVSTHAACRISQTGAVLDLHADQSISVVAAPDLRTVVQHACVERSNNAKGALS